MPPKMMTVGQVVTYLKQHYGMVLSRQSIYNWMKKGLRDDTLQTLTLKGKPTSIHPTITVTTDKWVDDFLRRCGIECTKAECGGDPISSTIPAEVSSTGQGEADLGPGRGPAVSPPPSDTESESDLSGWDEAD